MNQKQKIGMILFVCGLFFSVIVDPGGKKFTVSVVSTIAGIILIRLYEPAPPKRDPSQASTLAGYVMNRINGNAEANADLDKEIVPDKVIQKTILYIIYGLLLLLVIVAGCLFVLYHRS